MSKLEMNGVKLQGKDKGNLETVVMAAIAAGLNEVTIVIDGEEHTIRITKKDAEGRQFFQE